MSMTSLPVRRVSRSTRRVAAICVVVAAAALVASCASDGSEGADDTTSTSASTTTESTSAPASTEPTTPAQPGDSTWPGDAATTQVSVPQPDIPTAELVDVMVEQLGDHERVVFRFNGEVPGYDVGFVDLPVTQDGSGDPIDLNGSKAISVRMTPASGVRLLEDGIEETYVGPDRVPGGGDPITDVVRAGDFEAQSTWAIGVQGDPIFQVTTMTNPTRLVVDVGASQR